MRGLLLIMFPTNFIISKEKLQCILEHIYIAWSLLIMFPTNFIISTEKLQFILEHIYIAWPLVDHVPNKLYYLKREITIHS